MRGGVEGGSSLIRTSPINRTRYVKSCLKLVHDVSLNTEVRQQLGDMFSKKAIEVVISNLLLSGQRGR